MTSRELWPGVTEMLDRAGLRGRLSDLLEHLRIPLYRNAYALVANSVLSSGLGLLYWVLVARLYSAEDVGRNSAIISSLTFLAGISQLNLRPVMGRFIPVAGARTRELVTIGYVMTTLVSVAIGVAFILGIGLWARSDVFASIQGSSALSATFVVLTGLWCLFSLQDGVLIGLRQAVAVLIENTLFNVAKIILAVAFALLAAVRSLGVVASWVIPMAAAVVLVNVLAFRRFIPEHASANPATDRLMDARGMVRYVGGDYVGSLFAVAYATLLPVIVINGLGAETSAHFYIVWVIFTSLQLVPVQMVTSLVVETVADPGSWDRHARHVAVQIARILVPIGLVLILGAPLVLQAFGRGYASEGADLMRLLVLSLGPWAVINLYFGYCRVHARVRGIAIGQALLAVGILGLSAVLLPHLGLAGVGVANLVTVTALAIAVGVTALRSVFLPRTGARPA